MIHVGLYRSNITVECYLDGYYECVKIICFQVMEWTGGHYLGGKATGGLL